MLGPCTRPGDPRVVLAARTAVCRIAGSSTHRGRLPLTRESPQDSELGLPVCQEVYGRLTTWPFAAVASETPSKDAPTRLRYFRNRREAGFIVGYLIPKESTDKTSGECHMGHTRAFFDGDGRVSYSGS